MPPLILLLWVLVFCSQVAVVLRAWRSKISEYPLFFAWMLFSICRSCALFCVAGDPMAYRKIYFATDRACLLLEGVACLEAFFQFAICWPWAGRLGFMATVAALTIASGAYAFVGGAQVPATDKLMVALADNIRFIGFTGGMVLLLVATVFNLPGFVRRRVIVHAYSMAGLMLVPAAVMSLPLAYNAQIVQAAYLACYCASLVFWVTHINQKEKPTRVTSASGRSFKDVLSDLRRLH